MGNQRLLTLSLAILLVFSALLHGSIIPVRAACTDPNDPSTWPDATYNVQSAQYVVQFTQTPKTDKSSYHLAETVVVSGVVGLAVQLTLQVTSATCGYSVTGNTSDTVSDVSTVSIAINGTTVGNCNQMGAFSGSVQLSGTTPTTAPGNLDVTATQPDGSVDTSQYGYSSGSVSATGSSATAKTNDFKVVGYTATLAATVLNSTINGGDVGYPGDIISVSGNDWVPNVNVTVTVPGDPPQTSSGPSFTGLRFMIPDDAPKGSLQITANQTQGNFTLSQQSSITVQYLPATVTITPNSTSVKQGSAFEFKVAVSCNGNASPGAALNITSDLPASSLSSTGVTDSNGNYMISGTLSTNETAGTHTITVNATPNIGCDPGSAAVNLQVGQLAFTDVLSNTLTNLFSGTVSVASLLLVGVVVTIIVAVAVFFRKKWRVRLESKTNDNTHDHAS